MKTWVAAIAVALVCSVTPRDDLPDASAKRVAKAWVAKAPKPKPAAVYTNLQLLDIARPAARAAWPGSPCAGREVVVFSDAEVRAIYPNPATAAAMAYQNGSCRVVIADNAPKDLQTFCDVLTHEFGHLAGLGHDAAGSDPADPRVAMSAPPHHWRGCDLTQGVRG